MIGPPVPTAKPTSHASPTRTPHPSPAPSTPTSRPSGKIVKFGKTDIDVPQGHGASISFTLDDGPSPKYTPQVLALLKQNHVPAVFCLIGTEARAYPALVRQEAQAGHRLCDHSRDHDLKMNHKSDAYVTAEVDDGLADILRAAPGVPVSYYRQPGGLWSPAVVRAMNRAKLHPLRWSNDPRDWSRPGSTVIVQRVVQSLHPGAVILMHDGGGDRSQTVEALAWLLPTLRAAGWHPVFAPRVTLSPKAAAHPQ
jgi:peptidoglycan/xylan/chitin deacetylase (PgdA/CDA1 family)